MFANQPNMYNGGKAGGASLAVAHFKRLRGHPNDLGINSGFTNVFCPHDMVLVLIIDKFFANQKLL